MKLGFLKIESYKKGIVFSTAFNFLSKLLLFLQSVAIAYYFGAQASTDVFFYCFATITLLSLFINNLDSSVLIPEAMRLNEQESREKATQFLNFFLYSYFFVGFMICVLFYIAPVKFFLFLSNFDPAILQENKEILLLSIPLFTLMITVNLMVNILASNKFFTIPMVLSSFNGITVLLVIFLFHDPLKIKSVLIGLLFAYMLNIFFLVYIMKKNIGWKFSFIKISLGKKILKNMLFAQAGNITSVLSSYVPIYLLSSFGSGMITSLTYGQKTADLPNQLVTLQFSSVAGIKFNELYAKKDYNELNRVFVSVMKVLLFILIPISALIFLYSNGIISVFFERGVFDAESVESSALFLKYFGLILPLLAINTLVARLFMAAQKIKEAFSYQVLLNSTLIIIIIFSVEFWGPVGYPYSLIFIHLANLFFTYVLLKIIVPFIKYHEILIFILKLIILNGCISAFIYYLNNMGLLPDKPLLNIISGASLYGVLILIINYFVQLNQDLGMIFPMMRRSEKNN